MERCENLKVGDKVFVYGNNGRRLDVVEKITPKGFIKVSGVLFTQYGSERGNCSPWYRTHIEPATEVEIENYNKQKIVTETIRKMHNVSKIPYEIALKIREILEQENIE